MLKQVREQHRKIKNQNTFLVDVFLMCNLKELDLGIWQLDYYDPKTSKITSFQIKEKDTEKSQPAESFKDPEKEIQPLDLDKVNIDFREALETSKAHLQKHTDHPKKLIAILQSLNNTPTWNISFITSNFFLHNSKINAISGELIKESYSSLLSFKAQ